MTLSSPILLVLPASTNSLCGFVIMQVLMRALSSPPFGNYQVWWSLSDSKYAGTALFVKKQFRPKKVSFSLDRTGNASSTLLECWNVNFHFSCLSTMILL